MVSACALFCTSDLCAGDAAAVGPDPLVYQKTVDRAIDFLAKQQTDDGSVGARIGIGPTAIVTLALLRSGRTTADPQVAKGLKYLDDYTQESGAICTPGSRIPNYETSIALMCLKEANGDKRFDKVIRAAETFVRGGQVDESKGKDKSDLSYGGEGYGGKSRPDLSNTAFLLDALKSAGAKADDPTIQKAVVFVSRCQNLESEHNTTSGAAKINDGGFGYTPTVQPQAGAQEGPGPKQPLRSYGSMTYSGLKSLIYAGLTKDDVRLKAAMQWIRKNYDVASNPGMGDAGLYYYYHTFAKTMDVLGSDQFEDAKGVQHDWRRELTEALAKRQQANGSWVNKNTKWMEGDPELATPLALLALTYCRPPSAKPAK
jgi:squalene-hopene/tetraprenyl-beta-curcumene cyclase